jgi:hypothetical protein
LVRREVAACVHRVDGGKLVALHQHVFRVERAALYAGPVSDFHSVRATGAKVFLASRDYRVVVAVPGSFHHAVCSGPLGILA